MARLTKSNFDYAERAETLSYGKSYDELYGTGAIELTVQQIIDLVKGKVLYSSVNDEYAILIRVGEEDG